MIVDQSKPSSPKDVGEATLILIFYLDFFGANLHKCTLANFVILMYVGKLKSLDNLDVYLRLNFVSLDLAFTEASFPTLNVTLISY